jgi:hypothetical protein
MVVLFLTLLVGPVVGTHARLNYQLITLARIACQRFAHSTEGYEPKTRRDFARRSALIFASIVVAHEAEACVARVVLGYEFGIAGQVANRVEGKTVHDDYSSDVCGVWGAGKSMHGPCEWNRDWLPVCAETQHGHGSAGRECKNLCMVGAAGQQWSQLMSFADSERNDGAVEECLDELNDFLGGLRYSPAVLAVALRVHLEGLLQALLEGRICTREEVRDFVRELEREALQYEED